MKILKYINNHGILMLIIGILLSFSISTYAITNYYAKDIKYIDIYGNETNIEDKLNYLENSCINDELISSDSKVWNHAYGSNFDVTFNIPKGATKAKVLILGGSNYGSHDTYKINSSNIIKEVKSIHTSDWHSGKWAEGSTYIELKLNGKEGIINIISHVIAYSNSSSSASIIIYYYK